MITAPSLGELGAARSTEDGLHVLSRSTHRLRNLVMSSRGYAELIARGEGDPTQWSLWGRRIVQQLDRLESMHARLDAARDDARPQRLDLCWLLRSADRRSRERVAEDAAAVETRMDLQDGLSVVGNPDALTEALAGLIDNAREATVAGAAEPYLRVSASQCEESGWSIVVADRGPGLDGEAAERIGEAFFTRKPGHMGIGVYLGRTLLDRHGLSLDIANAREGGTEAIIRQRPRPSGGDR